VNVVFYLRHKVIELEVGNNKTSLKVIIIFMILLSKIPVCVKEKESIIKRLPGLLRIGSYDWRSFS
jgi:hypothetical protein